MRRPAVLAALGLAAFLAGCSEAAPTPADFPRLSTQPYFEPIVVEWAAAYRQALGEPLPFDLDTRTRQESLGQVEAGESGLLITSGEPPRGWFATPLGPQGVAVVVHPDNPVRDLTIRELGDLFSGLAGEWGEVGGRSTPVQPVLPLPGEPFGDAFASMALAGEAPWPGTLLAPTTTAMAQVIAEDRGAVGILPLPAVPEGLRVVRVDGVLPGDTTIATGTYPLTVSLLATAPTEPEGALRDFLAWVQAVNLLGFEG
jgi:phosphate transport system substrate-binding protein